MTRAQASAVPKRTSNCTMTVISLPQGTEGDRSRRRKQDRNLLIGEPLYAIAQHLQDESPADGRCVNAGLGAGKRVAGAEVRCHATSSWEWKMRHQVGNGVAGLRRPL